MIANFNKNKTAPIKNNPKVSKIEQNIYANKINLIKITFEFVVFHEISLYDCHDKINALKNLMKNTTYSNIIPT